MQLENIKKEIRGFIGKGFHVTDLEDETNIFSRGGVHSLFFMQLLVFIEKRFSVELYDGEFDINKLQTISQIALLIDAKVNVHD